MAARSTSARRARRSGARRTAAAARPPSARARPGRTGAGSAAPAASPPPCACRGWRKSESITTTPPRRGVAGARRAASISETGTESASAPADVRARGPAVSSRALLTESSRRCAAKGADHLQPPACEPGQRRTHPQQGIPDAVLAVDPRRERAARSERAAGALRGSRRAACACVRYLATAARSSSRVAESPTRVREGHRRAPGATAAAPGRCGRPRRRPRSRS